MSNTLRLTLVGDWWYYAGALKMLLSVDDFVPTDGEEPNGWVLHAGNWEQDTALITGCDGRTTITITIRNAASGPPWSRYAAQLQDMAAEAREMRRTVLGPTGEEVIELYYRSRAAGHKKTTLRQLAQQYGFHPNYLSQVKRAYDEAGGWGSKTKAAPSQKS